MRLKKILSLLLAMTMLFSCIGITAMAEETGVAKIGDESYATLAYALAAASAMTGDVTVEIYDKVTLNQSLSGSYDSIAFVGKDTDAEIYLDVQGYITANGKAVAFEELTLTKSEGGFITNAGFMNVAFGVYEATTVTYTNCTFSNGAYASSGTNTFTDCTFYRSHDKYGLWAYGNVDIVVDGCTFADYRGIKMYAEGAAKTVDLTVKNTDFSELDSKPAIVLTYGESVALENNTYSSTGVFELDLDGAPNGTPVTSDVAPTCKNDNGACGVLVDGKIYITVAQAAEVAAAGSTVTLLHNSTETVEFVEGVTLNKNGFEAEGVTVKSKVPSGSINGGLVNLKEENRTFLTIESWITYANESIVVKVYDANDTLLVTSTLVDTDRAILGTENWGGLSTFVGINCTDGWWNVEWEEGKLSADYVPAKATLFVDGVEMNTAPIQMRAAGTETEVVWAEVPGVPSGSVKVATKAELDAAISSAKDGDTILLTSDIDYTGTSTLTINKAITLDLGGHTLTTNGTYGGLILKGNCSLKNGTLNHRGTVAAIKAWNVETIEDVVIDVAFKEEGKTIGGIVIQNVSTNRIDTMKNVTIKGEGLTNGIETYNCGDAVENVIGSMENVTIDAVGTGMLISAPCGTATNCDIKGGTTGIELWIKGTYSASLDLKGCKVDGGEQALFIHDEFTSNPDAVNNGTLKLTADDETTFENEKLVMTIARAENLAIDDDILKMRSLQGAGTAENPYIINNLNDLKWFRDDVNAGNTYAGKYVKLADDIDLAGEEWTPIAKFEGVFDGDNKIISNLIVNGGSNNDQGFFAVTMNGEIKNLTFNNAKVSGRLNVGVVAGTPYTSKYTNIKITGHVEVNGMSYVGGMGGKNGYANITDITINVDSTSYVKATSTENGTAYRTYVGGVIGFMGEGGHTVKNVTSNINVIGDVCDIGGIVGIAHYGNNFENVVCAGNVTNTNTDAADSAETGGIAGVWHNQKGYTVTFTNCSFTGKVTATGVAENAAIGAAYNATNNSETTSGSLVIDGETAWPIPELPTATVTELENSDLTFALNFTADEVTEKQLAYYGDWYADFVLTINKDFTANANGNADGYLSGQYDAWSENWVNVPFEDVTISADSPLKIMEYAATLMGQSGLKLTYNDVYSFVKNFDCGVFFNDEYIAANPDLEVTLELRMYNPKDESESYAIGETYVFDKSDMKKVAEIDGVGYVTLQSAIAAAEANDTIILLDNVTEDVTIDKSITLDGADKNYTGTMTISDNKTVTIQNVNFVKGSIAESKGTHGNLTIKNCDFDGVDKSIGYAITIRGGDKLVIENCTAKNYSTGMLYIPSSVANISVKDVKVSDVAAAFNISYSGNATFENVNLTNVTYGLHVQNYGARTFTLKGWNAVCDYPLYIQERGTENVTFEFVGENALSKLTKNTYAKLVLGETDAVLTAPEGYNVTTDLEGYIVKYVNGVYKVVEAVAQIGDTYYETFEAAIADAKDNDTITLIWEEGDAPIAMNGAVYGKSVTITGDATVDWSKNFLFVGRGGEGNGTVIFDKANLKSASNSSSYGIHVSGREKNTNNKYDGTVIIKDSTIELDYLINKSTMTLDNSKLTVKNGFSVGGRPASETESGEDAIATITLNNNSKVIVNKHNGMGLGYEALGVMNIESGSTFEYTQDFLITAKGTMNINGGKVIGNNVTLTNKGTVNISGTSDIAANVTGDGWVYMNGVTMSDDTKLIGAKVRFASGTNNIDGSVIDDGFFQVGIGAYNGVDANVDTTNGVTVNVKNAKIGSNGKTYAGWVGTGFYDTDAEKADVMTDAKYVLNIDNSIAEFGYLHISNDGELNVKGNAAEKAHYNNSDYSFYAGDFIINGTATFDATDVLALYTKVSCDNGTDKPGTFNIKNDAYYEAERHNGAIDGTNFILYKTGVANVDETSELYIGEPASIATDAVMNIGGKATALGTITNNGTINLTTANATLTTPEAPVVNSTVDGYEVAYADGKYSLKEVEEVELFDINLMNLSLKSSMQANFYVLASVLDGTDYYAEIIHRTATGEEIPCVIDFDDWTDNGSYKQIKYTELSAKNMADIISVTIYHGDGTPASNTRETSIKTYAENYIKNNAGSDDKWVTPFVDMLNYGAAAQQNFGYNTENLANAGIADYKNYATQEDVVLENVAETSASNILGANLSLKDHILYNAFFANVTADMRAEVSYTSHSGELMMYEVELVPNGSFHQVSVKSLVIADANQLITITVYDGAGNVHAYIKDTVNSYLFRTIPRETPEFEVLARAMAKFTASAHTALHTK